MYYPGTNAILSVMVPRRKLIVPGVAGLRRIDGWLFVLTNAVLFELNINNRRKAAGSRSWASDDGGSGIRKSEQEMTWKWVEVVKSKRQAMGQIRGLAGVRGTSDGR